MSKTDFQNGFALGRASGGVVSIDGQVIAAALAEFKDKEIAWEKIYSYNVGEYGDTKVYFEHPIYEISFTKVPHYFADGTKGYSVRVEVLLAIARRYEGKELEYLVDSPLEVSYREGSNGGYLNFNVSNIDNLFDAGISIEGEYMTFSQMMESMVDGETFVSGNLSFLTRHSVLRQAGLLRLEITLSITTKDEEIADMFLPEIENIFTIYGDTFLLFYRNAPEVEEVEAKYLGGNN